MPTEPDYFAETYGSGQSPDYFKDADKPAQPQRADWKKHEADVEKRSGDRRVPGSGNQPGRPMDNMGKRGRECKAFRSNEQITGAGGTIQGSWLVRLVEQAMAMNKRPVMELRFERAKFPVPTDWILLPATDYQDLEERANAHGD